MKETVYEHADGNDTFTITAAEKWSISMINKLKRKRPDEVEIVHTNPDGSMVVHLPFSWMRIIPKKNLELSDERRQEMADRMREIASKTE